MSAYALDDERLRPLPPSSKLVYQVLRQHEDPMSRQDISEASMLPYTTTGDALAELTDKGIVDTHRLSGDARRVLFSVPHTPGE